MGSGTKGGGNLETEGVGLGSHGQWGVGSEGQMKVGSQR